MTPNSDLPCWEIMKCEGTEECLARKNPKTPCWEIAGEIDDYRRAFNICRDCVVFMLKEQNTTLSKVEMKNIMEKRGVCALA